MKRKYLLALFVVALFLSGILEQEAKLIPETKASFSSYIDYQPKWDTHSHGWNATYNPNGVMVYGNIMNTSKQRSTDAQLVILATEAFPA